MKASLPSTDISRPIGLMQGVATPFENCLIRQNPSDIMSGELTAKYLAWVGQCLVCVAADFSLTVLGDDGVEAIALMDFQTKKYPAISCGVGRKARTHSGGRR